jgi:hypothetical protein
VPPAGVRAPACTKPKKEITAPISAHAAAVRNARSIRCALIADQIMHVSMKPCDRATSPCRSSPAIANAFGSASTRAASPGSPVALPAAPSACVSTSAPHAAIAGKSPTATAGACSAGVAWNACAVMITPIHSTIAMPASIGTSVLIKYVKPKSASAAKKSPFRIE